jgi:hypothetical protein
MRKEPHINNLVICKQCPLEYCLNCQPAGCKCGSKAYLMDHKDIKGEASIGKSENTRWGGDSLFTGFSERITTDYESEQVITPPRERVRRTPGRLRNESIGIGTPIEALETIAQDQDVITSMQPISYTTGIDIGEARGIVSSTGDASPILTDEMLQNARILMDQISGPGSTNR